MKKAILVFIVVIFTTFNFAFAQGDPMLKMDMVPMLTITGNPGERFQIQYSLDIGKTDPWKVLGVVSTYDKPVVYCDTSSVGQPRRFYRLFKLPPANSLEFLVGSEDINMPQTIEVDESDDTDNGNAYSILLKAVGADITIQKIQVSFQSGETSTAKLEDMINSVGLHFNEGEYKESVIASIVNFNFDNSDPTKLRRGDSRELIIRVDLNSQSGNYDNGSSFLVSGVTVNYIDQYGNPGILSSTIQGGLKVLRTFGANFGFVSSSAQSIGESSGQYQIRFRLEAFSEDAFIPANGTSVIYEILNEEGEVLNLPTSITLSSTADEIGGYFLVQDGDSEMFTFDVYVNNDSQPSPQNIRVRLKNVGCRFNSITDDLEANPLVVPDSAQTQLLLLQN